MRSILAALVVLVMVTAAHAAPSEHELAVLTYVNVQRVLAGRAPVTWNDELYAAAKVKSDEQAAHGGNCPAHDSCNGELWWKLVQRYYVGWFALGQNVATSVDDPAFVVGQWVLSPVHQAILINGSFTEMGAALSPGPTAFGTFWWATANFGSRGFVPVPTPTPGIPLPTPVATAIVIDQLKIRHTATKTTVSGLVEIPPDVSLLDSVSLAFGTAAPIEIPASCIVANGRGIKSKCGPASFHMAPAGLPRYRFRFIANGIFTQPHVTLSVAGQEWDG